MALGRAQDCGFRKWDARKWLRVLVAIGPASAFFLAGCAADPHDDQTARLITSLQSDTDALLVNLSSLDQQIDELQGNSDPTAPAALDHAREAASYDANLSSYNQIRLDLATLKIRVDARNNANTQLLDVNIGQVEDLLFGRGSLSATHQSEGVVGRAAIIQYQSALDAQFSAMLNYELNGPPTPPPDDEDQSATFRYD